MSLEITRRIRCNRIGNSVAGRGEAAGTHQNGREQGGHRYSEGAQSLYDRYGARKYLNRNERDRALKAMAALGPDAALFALTLAWTGARVSEVLALTPASFQIEAGIVAIATLKRRKPHVREVPIPPALMGALNRQFGLSARQEDPDNGVRRLWPWHRATAWRVIKRVMALARIGGCRASPRGLRHAFGVGTLQSGVPLTLAQRWLGHARASAPQRSTPMSAGRRKSASPRGFGDISP